MGFADTVLGRRAPAVPRYIRANNRDGNRVYDFFKENDQWKRGEPTKRAYMSNVVRTTKYGFPRFIAAIAFIPRNLFEQFNRVANIYFLFVTILYGLPTSPKSFGSMVGTFTFMLVATMVKDLAEDYYRWKADHELNCSETRVLRDGALVVVQWREIIVGDIVQIRRDEAIPADLFYLSSSDQKHGQCFIDTCQLDGETNLKAHLALAATKNLATPEAVGGFTGAVESEAPHAGLYKYSGKLEIGGDVKLLGPSQVILRGCVVRNTDWMYGLVLNTGHECKIMLNGSPAAYKMSKLMVIMNKCLLFAICCDFLICTLHVILSLSLKEARNSKTAISQIDPLAEDLFYKSELNPEIIFPRDSTAALLVVERFMTFIVLYANIIPISLYIAMELYKISCKKFIDWDIEMYHTETDTPALARTSGLIEELGQVEIIFSDKTGTLTANVMEFACCSVGGVTFGDFEGGEGETAGGGGEQKEAPGCMHGKSDAGEDCSPYALPGAMFRDSGAWDVLSGPESPQRHIMFEFWKLLALCHSVIPEHGKKSTDPIVYQAASPDEKALVEAASNMGVKFSGLLPGSMTLEVNGSEVSFELLQVLEFSSARKCMSVIVRDPDGTIKLYVKGADDVIRDKLKNINGSGDGSARSPWQSDPAATQAHLEAYARQGLRTLCCAMRTVGEEEYGAWVEGYEMAKTSLTDADAKTNACIVNMEKNLVFLGAVAIEDKLQSGVPETIVLLRRAKLRIWVLTGDKQETAINIANSCKLIDSTFKMYTFGQEIAKEGGRVAMTEMIKDALQHRRAATNAGMRPVPAAIVMHGIALGLLLEPEPGSGIQGMKALKEMQENLVDLSWLCDSVVCCRVSPRQKAEVVKMVKRSRKCISLAIGDGANDVPMIQAANVGVGIKGKEGTQAARSSDYAIGQFRFLSRLMLVHGRRGYRNLSLFVKYYFYKNMVIALCEFFFAFYNGYSGDLWFDTWLALAYNAMFTSFPVIFGLMCEFDVTEVSSIEFPQLYAIGPNDECFNLSEFMGWMLMALWHAACCYVIPVYALTAVGPDGQDTAKCFVAWASFTCVIWVVCTKMCIMLHMWNKVFAWATVVGLVLYHGAALVICTEWFSRVFAGSFLQYDIFLTNFESGAVALVVPFTVVIAMLPDVTLQYVRRQWSPYSYQIIQEMEIERQGSRGTAPVRTVDVVPVDGEMRPL